MSSRQVPPSASGLGEGVGVRSVVAIGGGHGLAATLGALRQLEVRRTAVVSVADDGGSSGRLRANTERVALGDLRKCLLALSDDSGPMSRAVAHRFDEGDLRGHSFGNLLIATLEATEGDLLAALEITGSLLGACGRVIPVTTEAVELVAELESGAEVVGQVAIAGSAGIREVHLDTSPRACPVAVEAIGDADLVVLGPGSLFTSVLAALVVPGISNALAASAARVVYVCNLQPQEHETDGFDLSDHVSALDRHGIHPDSVLYDPAWMTGCADPVDARAMALADPSGRAHDTGLLARALQVLLDDGPAVDQLTGVLRS